MDRPFGWWDPELAWADEPHPDPLCPRCNQPVMLGQAKAFVGAFSWHAGCFEDHEMDRLEEADMGTPEPCV